MNAFADFVDAVVKSRSVLPTFEDGLHNRRVLDAVSASAKSLTRMKI